MGKCVVMAHVKNLNGEVVESKLFKDLLHYTSNRSLTKEYYAVGTNSEFLNQVGDRAEFDENGEITFTSLKNITGLQVDPDALLQKLNKDIQSGEYEYMEAMVKLQGFNRNNPFNKNYMATLTSKDNKYVLSVVPKTLLQERRLENLIKNESIQNRIIYYVNRAGASIKFLEDSKFKGRYSTANASKTAEGLYALIDLSKDKHTTEDLAEEAGHFAIGALGDNPLVQRLQKLLESEEVQRKILDGQQDKVLGLSSTRELAGMLVGRALNGSIDTRAPWQSLVRRIVDAIRKIFSTIKQDDAKKAMIEAVQIADKIAKGFTSPNFNGTIQNALDTQETLYSAENSVEVKTYKEALANLHKTVIQLKNINNDNFAKIFETAVGVIDAEKSRGMLNPSIYSNSMALEGIAEICSVYEDLTGDGKEIDNLLKSVDFSDVERFYEKLPENANKLRKVHTFVQNSSNLIRIIEASVDSLNGTKPTLGGSDINRIHTLDILGQVHTYDLTELVSNLKRANACIISSLHNKERGLYLKFCENILGKDYVTISSKLIFKKNPKGLLDFEKGRDKNISEYIDFLSEDINFFDRWICSMANNPDVIGQIADKAVKMSNNYANIGTESVYNKLRVLKSKFKDLGIPSTAVLFEKNEDGSYTGNIISPLNWGKYEQDYAKMKKEAKEQFIVNTPNYDNMTDFEKGVAWDMYFKPIAKAWHKDHSAYDASSNKLIPASSLDNTVYSYDNPEYNKLMSQYNGLQQWYNQYTELKRNLDSLLPPNSTLSVRMPQFKGIFTNKVKNRAYSGENTLKRGFKTLKSEIVDSFCESSEDTDYGSNNTYNNPEEDILFTGILAMEKEKLHRLPLFGINKLQKKIVNPETGKKEWVTNMDDLSTDVFESTLAYAAMAYNYSSMSLVVDTLEIGKQVLGRRKVKSLSSEEEKLGNTSNAYHRYLKFIDKSVYGVGATKITLGRVVVNKILDNLNKIAAMYFLGGNVHGGIVNLGTGFNELFKEALAAEHINMRSFHKANKIFFKLGAESALEYGKKDSNKKFNLLMRKWNILGENKLEYRDYNDHSRLFNIIFEKSLFFPYKVGENYMNSISYLATGYDTPLFYVENGEIKETNLIDANEVMDLTDDEGNVAVNKKKKVVGKTIGYTRTYYKSKDSIAQAEMLQSILDKIENSQKSLLNGIKLTPEEQQYLDKRDLKLENTSSTKVALEYQKQKLVWTQDDEVKFMNKASELNNRMHYQKDPVAFQQMLFGNAILAMRKWALGLYERRFSTSRYSVALDSDSGEGSYVTVAKVIASTFMDSGGFLNTIRAICFPFGKRQQQAMTAMGFSAHQMANMRRNFGDNLFVLMLLMLKLLFAKPDPDDEDDDVSNAEGMIYYFANRLLREQEAFNLMALPEMFTETFSLLSLMPSGVSALFDMMSLVEEFLGAQVADETNKNYFYQKGKKDNFGNYLYEKGDPKWEEHFLKMTPFIRTYMLSRDFYKATDAFEYGRKQNSR